MDQISADYISALTALSGTTILGNEIEASTKITAPEAIIANFPLRSATADFTKTDTKSVKFKLITANTADSMDFASNVATYIGGS
jgi:hypothetical protein